MSKHRKTTNSVPLPLSRIREGGVILVFAGALFLMLALGSYHHQDPGWSHASIQSHVVNLGGKLGAWMADFLLYIFGYVAYSFPLGLMFMAWSRLRQPSDDKLSWRLLLLSGAGFLAIVSAGSGLAGLHINAQHLEAPLGAGGVLGHVVGSGLAGSLGLVGTTVLLLAFFLSGITFLTGLSWLQLIDTCGYRALQGVAYLREGASYLWQFSQAQWARYQQAREKKKRQTPTLKMRLPKQRRELPRVEPEKAKTDADEITAPVPQVSKPRTISKAKSLPNESGSAGLPSVSLLDAAEAQKNKGYSNAELEDMAREVEKRLQDFNVSAQVVEVHPGPVVTRFELQLAPGVKVSKVTGLAKDLARSLSVVSVRVVEVIPGKSVVGLELPNKHREVVRLSELISSPQYQKSSAGLSLVLGKDISGASVVVDLAKMPHLLVAGTTGSGKSVGINAMLLSMLYQHSAENLRLILIDPKMLELSIYADIPHLLAPVVTDMKEAANALRWCVNEMERRYRLMATLGVRNLANYNAKVLEAEERGNPLLDPLWQPQVDEEPAVLSTLSSIVIVIDEFADMMMVVGKKVETLIARIAQKARAAGIHMILATQRPSVDVITGLIKANVPTRVAFQVSSRIDSRTIIDQQGAEQLLGYGDMLYLPPGSGVPIRVHGAFVDDHEVHTVVEYLKQQGEPDYLTNVTADNEPLDSAAAGGGSAEDQDPLYDEAVAQVLKTRRASVSALQRRLKIGFNRAARLVEAMEDAGLVSEMDSSGNREILVPEGQEG